MKFIMNYNPKILKKIKVDDKREKKMSWMKERC